MNQSVATKEKKGTKKKEHEINIEDFITFIPDSRCTKDTPVIYGKKQDNIYGKGICIYPKVPGKREKKTDRDKYLEHLDPLETYTKIIVYISGGADSVAMVLDLLERGVPPEKIELWHHDVDGNHPSMFMDWKVTHNYISAFAQAFKLKLRISMRNGGYWDEVYRMGSSQPIRFNELDGKERIIYPKNWERSIETRGYIEENKRPLPERWEYLRDIRDIVLLSSWNRTIIKKLLQYLDRCEEKDSEEKLYDKWNARKEWTFEVFLKQMDAKEKDQELEDAEMLISAIASLRDIGYRYKTPAKSNDLLTRYCSSAIKIEVGSAMLNHAEDTKYNCKLLVLSGERRGESPNRAAYNEIELHRSHAPSKNKRIVHHWKSVINHSERDVWEILKRNKVTPHPCYSAGWNRASCALCVYSGPTHLAGIKEILPEAYQQLQKVENDLNFTIDNKKDIDSFVGEAQSCVKWDNKKAIEQLVSGDFTVEDIFTEDWDFPAGSFKGSDGGPC